MPCIYEGYHWQQDAPLDTPAVFGITCTINNTEAVFKFNGSITNSISLTQEQLNGSTKETILDCVNNGTDWRCTTEKTDLTYRIMSDILRVELSPSKENEGRYTCQSVPPTNSDPTASCKFEVKETTSDGVDPALIIVPIVVGLVVVGIIVGIILWRRHRKQLETRPNNNSASGLPAEEQNQFILREQQRKN
ncbi:hypothetical protein BaRGS_00033044 [Batillaria attramentaria]|uniref:Ig-like domain-containing protein n=1 Tax=Batillaria attramentaria TaxID=370345 RepID=A0ABD0JL89_9CAEN